MKIPIHYYEEITPKTTVNIPSVTEYHWQGMNIIREGGRVFLVHIWL